MKLVIFGVAYLIMVIVMLMGNKKQWKWMDFDIPLEEKAFEKRYCMLLMPVIGFDVFLCLQKIMRISQLYRYIGCFARLLYLSKCSLFQRLCNVLIC